MRTSNCARAYELFMISLIVETCCVKNGTCKRGLDVIAREFTSCLIARLKRPQFR